MNLLLLHLLSLDHGLVKPVCRVIYGMLALPLCGHQFLLVFRIFNHRADRARFIQVQRT